MTRPRSSLVSVLETPWYHVVSRCVRRAFLCGQDHYSGRSFEHRRAWVEQRLLKLAAVFAVDIAAYAVMSNHYHIVLRIDLGRAEAWSDEEVLRRWTQLFTGPLLVQRALSIDRETLSAAELTTVTQIAAVYRGRLADLSWFTGKTKGHPLCFAACLNTVQWSAFSKQLASFRFKAKI